jgi:hypothetical protein
MEFRKSYTLSLSDYMSYNRFSHRRQLLLMPALFIVLMLAICLFMIFGVHAAGLDALAFVIPLVVAFAGLIAAVNVVMMNKQALRQYQGSAALKSEFELVINRDGIRETGAGGSSKAVWQQIAFAVESRRAIYVHISAYRAFVIPKALLNPKEDAIIRKLLASHLAGKKCRIRH